VRLIELGFSERLKEIEEIIKTRNNKRIKPYTYAYPSKIDNSIKI
jgi:hypothetical protein